MIRLPEVHGAIIFATDYWSFPFQSIITKPAALAASTAAERALKLSIQLRLVAAQG